VEDLFDIVSSGAGITPARLQLYTLFNEPSTDPLDFYFEDEKHYAGYAQPLGDSQQVVWVVDESGYKDLTLRE